MPNKSFTAKFGEQSFPLRPTESYTKLKVAIGDKLKSLYKLVDAPAPAPEKPEHGDIDFAVCEPYGTVNAARVQKTLGAQLMVEEGSRIARYAVPTIDGKFVQVNVETCDNKAEFDGIIFFRSYGDLGMILGVLTKAHGLSLGSKGLKIQSSQNDKVHPSSFQLSSSFPKILQFMGLSIKTWENGFNSMKELFAWIQTSRFFVPRLVSTTADEVKAKNLDRRIVYTSFLRDTRSLASAAPSKPVLQPSAVVQEALLFFGKKVEYDAIVKANVKRNALQHKFTGTHVMKWTGLEGIVVRDVMKGVRERLGEEGIVNAKVEDIEKVTKEVQQKLNLYPKKKN